MNKIPARNFSTQKGAIPLLVIIAIVGILVFFAFTSVAPFKDKFLSQLYPKPLSYAADIQPVGQTAGWNLVFSDEFDGTSLDLTKWRPNWLGSSDTAVTKAVNSSETACYDPSQVSIANGILALTAIKSACSANGINYSYRSGMVESNGKYNFAYGYSEAKIWTPAGTGVWPAFWTNGQSWPSDGEIDIVESYGNDESTYHYHYAGCGGDCGPGGSAIVSGATAGWHTYAANWEPGKITWYYDGKQVWQYTTNIISSPHYLILNLGLNSSAPTIPSTMKVDYVRVWQKDPNFVSLTSTLIAKNATWKYLDNGTNQNTAWRANNFDDSNWKSGTAILGYGQGNESTVISYGPDSNNKFTTSYFRNSFYIADPTAVTSLGLSLLRDDGAIVYLNGSEVFRTNMPTNTINYNTFASEASDDGYQTFTNIINPNLLVAGKNTIAVEVHQSTLPSSDLTHQLELTAKLKTSTSPVPSPTLTPTLTPTLSPIPTQPPQADTTPPTVVITNPLNGATIRRNNYFIISANASDNKDVTKVEFYVDGKLKCTDNTTSYGCRTRISDQSRTSHEIISKAYDSSNNYSSDRVIITLR